MFGGDLVDQISPRMSGPASRKRGETDTLRNEQTVNITRNKQTPSLLQNAHYRLETRPCLWLPQQATLSQYWQCHRWKLINIEEETIVSSNRHKVKSSITADGEKKVRR